MSTAQKCHSAVDRPTAVRHARTRRTARTLVLALLLTLAAAGLNAAGASAAGPVQTTVTCTGATFSYSGFPNANNNTVNQYVKVDGVLVYSGKFVFNGPTGSNTVPLHIPPGTHEVRLNAQWKTNGFVGETGRHVAFVTCAATPGFSIEKLQEIAGSGKGFTTAEVSGKLGQTVNYEIIVTNTGNVPLTFSEFTDEKCDSGTIAGGPGANPVEPGKSTTYTCKHVLVAVGKYTNAATVTGTPPEGDGGPITHTSNTVVANVPAEPSFSIEKLQEIAGSGKGFTTAQLAANVGQTVDYEIIVKNTGNVPLTFSEFTDEKCDSGTIAGGPGANPVEPGESTTYTCDHVFTEADKTAGLYTNNATDTGTPPEGDGGPITHTSNTVIVEVPPPHTKVKTSFTCNSVTFTFTGFPNRPGNRIYEAIKVDGVIVYKGYFTFNGPSGSNTIPISLEPGTHEIKANAQWKTNGVVGETGRQAGTVNCPVEPAFSIEKRQEIGGSGFTSSPIEGTVGQTVNYEIIVTNTGNVPLTFSEFTDEKCDGGTIAGGPGANPVAPGKSTTYTCSHVLTEDDHTAGFYTNSASDTATPPQGDGAPFTHTSNTVLVED
jgi:hypothetical protein